MIAKWQRDGATRPGHLGKYPSKKRCTSQRALFVIIILSLTSTCLHGSDQMTYERHWRSKGTPCWCYRKCTGNAAKQMDRAEFHSWSSVPWRMLSPHTSHVVYVHRPFNRYDTACACMPATSSTEQWPATQVNLSAIQSVDRSTRNYGSRKRQLSRFKWRFNVDKLHGSTGPISDLWESLHTARNDLTFRKLTFNSQSNQLEVFFSK
jgi:hypothetical protein